MLLCVKKRKGKEMFIQHHSSKRFYPNNVTMITLFYENDNMFNQDTYDNIIDQVDFMTVRCPHCNISGCLTKHARIREPSDCLILPSLFQY